MRKTIEIIFFLCILFIVGCSKSEYLLNEKITLTGDYRNTEVIDYFGSEQQPDYIPIAKIACTEHTEKCVLILEIDYKILYNQLTSVMEGCNIDLEVLDNKNYTPSDEQINCTRKIYEDISLI